MGQIPVVNTFWGKILYFGVEFCILVKDCFVSTEPASDIHSGDAGLKPGAEIAFEWFISPLPWDLHPLMEFHTPNAWGRHFSRSKAVF